MIIKIQVNLIGATHYITWHCNATRLRESGEFALVQIADQTLGILSATDLSRVWMDELGSHEGVLESASTAPHILNLGTRWRRLGKINDPTALTS